MDVETPKVSQFQATCLSETSSPANTIQNPPAFAHEHNNNIPLPSAPLQSSASAPPTFPSFALPIPSSPDHPSVTASPCIPCTQPSHPSSPSQTSPQHHPDKSRLLGILATHWTLPTLSTFIEPPHLPRAILCADGDVGPTLPLGHAAWPTEVLRELVELAGDQGGDAVTVGRNIAVQVERRLKRARGREGEIGREEVVGMTAGDVKRAGQAMRAMREGERSENGKEEGKVDGEEESGSVEEAPVFTKTDSPIGDAAPDQSYEPVVENECEIDTEDALPLTSIFGPGIVSSCQIPAFDIRCIRNLERKLEDIGFDRRELALDRREAKIRAALQDAWEE
ncbi:MAG: hypothetical protein M1822_000744 [Bathelium mastoideum]|nr:MAG: hypothetical protein M1822_000744 [Bathelium mastoideum]